MKKSNLINCRACGHVVSKNAAACPGCGSPPEWDEEAECLICRRASKVSDCIEVRSRYYHPGCVDSLFRIPPDAKCLDCGAPLNQMYSDDLATPTASKPCPNCGAPDVLQKLPFDCPWCHLPIYGAFQPNRSRRKGDVIGHFLLACARKRGAANLRRKLAFLRRLFPSRNR